MKEQALFILITPFLLLSFIFLPFFDIIFISVSCLPLFFYFFLFFKNHLKEVSSIEDIYSLTSLEKKKFGKECPSANLFQIPEQELDFSEQQTLPIELPPIISRKKRGQRF